MGLGVGGDACEGAGEREVAVRVRAREREGGGGRWGGRLLRVEFQGITKEYAYGLVVAADFRKAVDADYRRRQRDERVFKAPVSWC